MIPSYQQNTELKNEATKPIDILEDKRNIQVLYPNFETLQPMSYRKARNIRRPDKNLLNKRSEIISQRRHKSKYRLKTLASYMTSGDIT